MADRLTPIIIKRIKRGGGEGHSGGAWKVAYADFVTAMMAFFLLLWLLNSVTQEQLEGISNYFAPASISATKSGAGGVLGGQSVSQPIGSLIQSDTPNLAVELPPPTPAASEKSVTEQQAEEAIKKKEQDQFEEAVKELNNAIAKAENKDLAKSLIVENTAEGMRIQVVDQDGLAMFPSGSAQMFDHTRKVLQLVADVVKTMPQQISITGHTDAKRFAGGDTGYTNWELSADRANASRRALVQLGVPTERVLKVVGEAEKDPLLADDPDNARNRRIAIVLLRGTGAQAGATPAEANPPAPAAPAPAGTPPRTRGPGAVTAPLPPPVTPNSGSSDLFPK